MRLAIWLVLSWGAATAAFASQTAPYLPILMSVQDNEGRVWGVEAGDARGEKLWIWRDGGTSPQVKNANWPGSVGALIAAGQYPRFLEDGARRDPNGIVALGVGPDGRMWSWWETLSNKDDNVDRSGRRPIHRTRRLHAYRHDALGNAEAAGEWAESWEVPANELWRDPQAWKSTRLVWIGADAWILRAKMGQVESESGGGAVLQHLPSGKPEVITYPLPALDVRAFRELNMEVDAWRRIWLWGRVDAWPRKEVCFLGTFIDGTFDFSPRIADLPEGEITSLVMDSDKRGATVAVKSKGLWPIDFARLTASARPSPPLHRDEEVVSWRAWPDGTEVLLARHSALLSSEAWGSIWRRDEAGWRMLGGMAGEMRMRGRNAINPSQFAWSRVGRDVVLGGVGHAWILPVSGTDPLQLDWRVGLETASTNASYRLNDGCLLLARSGRGTSSAMIVEPAELTAALQRPPSPIEQWHNAIASDDGAIWSRRQTGPGRYETRRWREGLWSAWPEPGELDQNGVFAVDSVGRAWRYKRMERPAALLDPRDGASAGYRLTGSLRDLLETEARSGREFVLRTADDSANKMRAVAWGGAALAWTQDGRFEYWRAGGWTELPDLPGGWPKEMGFDSAGNPRFRMWKQKPRVWHASGGWAEVNDAEAMSHGWTMPESSGFVTSKPPGWLRTEIEKRQSGYPAPWQDEAGDWWVKLSGGLLRGRDGRVWPAIRAEVNDPWSVGQAFAGRVVRMPDGGMQFWAGDSVTWVPASALTVPPLEEVRSRGRMIR